jgi:quercetin dioxygenase-like cupin family protein
MSMPTFAEFESTAQAQGFDEVLERAWPANRVIDTHTHPFDVQALVVQGQFTLTYEGKTLNLTAGQSFTLARGIPHEERYGPEGATYWVARRGPSQ